MYKIFQNVFQKLGLSFVYTYGSFEPKLGKISVEKLKFSTFLIKRLDFSAVRLSGKKNRERLSCLNIVTWKYDNIIILILAYFPQSIRLE